MPVPPQRSRAAQELLALDPFGPQADDCCRALRRRAQRHAARGELRKAALVLRALATARGDAAHWVLLGDMLRRCGRVEEAREALVQGMWLHRRAGRAASAGSVARLLERLDWMPPSHRHPGSRAFGHPVTARS